MPATLQRLASRRFDVFGPLMAALALLFIHTAVLGDWLVDDAAISFAFARNAAAGEGLVAQPAADPVEGFSNPAWTLLFVVLYLADLVFMPWTPKILALAIMSAVIFLIWRQLKERARGLWLALPLVVLAGCTPFVVWASSGLENGLLAVLIVLACATTIHAVAAPSRRADLIAGVIAGLIALTRPEGVLYCVPHVLLVSLLSSPRDWRHAWLRTSTTAFGALLIGAPYLAFRWLYYHDVVPNTYYAKSHHPGADPLSLEKQIDLTRSVFGDPFIVIVPALLLAMVFLAARRRLTTESICVGTYLGIAVLCYLVLPYDWMGEFRFATPVFPLSYWFAAELCVAVTAVEPGRRVRTAGKWVIATSAAVLLVLFSARTMDFAAVPTFPMRDVEAAARGFNEVAAGIEAATLLTPDLGGALLESELRIVDLAGLCDRVVARTLGKDTDAFHEYIFGVRKPTFMRTHGPSLRLTRLYDDPRFTRDYVALHESHHPPDPEAWRRVWSDTEELPPWRGDYVRREALAAVPLDELQRRYLAARMDAWEPAFRVNDPFLRAPVMTLWALRRWAE